MTKTSSLIDGQTNLRVALEEELKTNIPKKTSGASIYRVPKNMRDVEPKAYSPNIISIGPYHHGAEDLRKMEELKWGFFHRLFNPSNRNGLKLEPVIDAMEKLFQLTSKSSSRDTSLNELALRFFSPLLQRDPNNPIRNGIKELIGRKHFLDLLRSMILPRSALEEEEAEINSERHAQLPQTAMTILRSVTELNEAGVMVMEEDVELLHYKGIIHHSLGSNKEVARLINSLCKDVAWDAQRSYVDAVIWDVNDYLVSIYAGIRARLVHHYFSSWAVGISTIAAFLALYLTLVQTGCGVVGSEVGLTKDMFRSGLIDSFLLLFLDPSRPTKDKPDSSE